MYFNIPNYDKDFTPSPEREWEKINDNEFLCQSGNASLRVFRYQENAPWWAECDNPEFESKAWFWTPEQAQYWAEKEINNWFN